MDRFQIIMLSVCFGYTVGSVAGDIISLVIALVDERKRRKRDRLNLKK